MATNLELNPKDSSPVEQPVAGDGKKRFWGLLCLRPCLVPTLRGWIIFAVTFGLLLTITIRTLHPFLAMNQPLPDGLLVVEGWMPDYGMEIVIEEFKRNHQPTIYVTGGPLEFGVHLSAYRTYAQLGAATLLKLGLSSNSVQAVPAPQVRQDRTYAAALTLKNWFLEHGITPTKINLMSSGPHARRSRLLFQEAMGKGVVVGVTAIPSSEYDQQHWWRYSAGVRSVIAEGLAYLYARFLFVPPKEHGGG